MASFLVSSSTKNDILPENKKDFIILRKLYLIETENDFSTKVILFQNYEE